MRHPEADVESWRNFLRDHECRWCWFCGRGPSDRPHGWYRPIWMIERAHIVAFPRIEDRRVAVLLCSMCHGREHGTVASSEEWQRPTREAMLWLKSRFDPAYYDRQFLQRFAIGKLPRARRNDYMLRVMLSRRPVARGIVAP